MNGLSRSLPSDPFFRRTRSMGVVGILALFVGCAEPPAEAPKQANIPVITEVAAPTEFQASIEMLGRLTAAARVEIRPPASGKIHYGPGFEGGLRTGQEVAEGRLLFRIEDPTVALRLAEAELTLQGAEADLERARAGVEAGIMPRAELESKQIAAALAVKRKERAEEEAARLAFRAPAAGTLQVERRYVSGTEVDPGVVLATLAGSGARRVEAWVAAGDLERLDVGLRVECRRPRRSGLAGTARLIEVAGEVEAGGVARVVAEVEDDNGLPHMGEGLDLRILLPSSGEALTVPEAALLVNGHIKRVFVLEPSGALLRAESRMVVTGGRSDGRVEILEGLKEGETIAVEGAEYLADGLTAEDVSDASKKGRG